MKGCTYIGLKAQNMGFDAHLTVFYLGRNMNKEEVELVKALLFQIGTVDIVVERSKIEMFSKDTPVVTVKSIPVLGDLYMLRKAIEQSGFVSPSQYPFNPHISLRLNNGNDIHIPRFIKLNQLGLY